MSSHKHNFIPSHRSDLVSKLLSYLGFHCLFCVAQLAVRVRYHEQLSPVCLPPAERALAPGTLCTVIGWGKRDDKDSEYHFFVYFILFWTSRLK